MGPAAGRRRVANCLPAEMEPEVRRQRLHESPARARAARQPRRTYEGMVYLVGAGPGDPELLTLKALRILGQADVVLHDDLLTPEILELIPSSARVECVGKRHNERQVTQEEINRRLCAYAKAGQTVVRLKGGDGAIFGRASEEMDALRAANIPFSIVPGVTAASGAAAAAGVSLTDRRLGSALVFLTAQRCKGNPPPNWKAVAELGGAAAIYMPGGHEAQTGAGARWTGAWIRPRLASWCHGPRGRTSRSSKLRSGSCPNCRRCRLQPSC